MKNKKADLSISTIVVIAISLIILVIIVFLVASRGRNLDDATKCTSAGGVCMVQGEGRKCVQPITSAQGTCGPDRTCCHPLGIVSS